MDFLKALFENGALSFEEFSKAVESKGYKLVNLAEGNYVAKKKYEDEISTLNTTITELNGQITTRDTDITNLKKQIEDAGNDAEKIKTLNDTISTMQTNYETAKSDYEARLNKQSYEFAVKEFANAQKFSSNAAKRDFVKQMISAELKMKDDAILGADDFAKSYAQENEDAFVVETPPAPPEGEGKPKFILPTPPAGQPETNPFEFNFMGVR